MQHSTQHAALRTTGGLAVVLAVVIAALCAVPAVGQFGADYRVGQGDVLEVYVYNEAELTQSYPVGPGGGITLPMVGRVQVIGNTTDEIRELLRKRLSEVIVNPFVTVSIDEAKSLRKVFVSGYVATRLNDGAAQRQRARCGYHCGTRATSRSVSGATDP